MQDILGTIPVPLIGNSITCNIYTYVIERSFHNQNFINFNIFKIFQLILFKLKRSVKSFKINHPSRQVNSDLYGLHQTEPIGDKAIFE